MKEAVHKGSFRVTGPYTITSSPSKARLRTIGGSIGYHRNGNGIGYHLKRVSVKGVSMNGEPPRDSVVRLPWLINWHLRCRRNRDSRNFCQLVFAFVVSTVARMLVVFLIDHLFFKTLP